MTSRRLWGLPCRVVAVVLPVFLAAGGTVWACGASSLTPSAYVKANPTEGPSGSTVQVTTHNVSAMNSPDSVSIIWGDSSNNCLLPLGDAGTADSATVSVNIPNSAPGYYYIGMIRGQFRGTPVAFTIPAGAGQQMPPKPANYGSPDSSSYSLGAGAGRSGAPAASSTPAAPPPPVFTTPATAQPATAGASPSRTTMAATTLGAAPASRSGGSTVTPVPGAIQPSATPPGTALAIAPPSTLGGTSPPPPPPSVPDTVHGLSTAVHGDKDHGLSPLAYVAAGVVAMLVLTAATVAGLLRRRHRKPLG